jgi:hypothetical protein
VANDQRRRSLACPGGHLCLQHKRKQARVPAAPWTARAGKRTLAGTSRQLALASQAQAAVRRLMESWVMNWIWRRDWTDPSRVGVF